ncbi:hypothetical protein [Amycolatopsis kentuckyensis]|uniref:hypothetical protein n=1 Tax=Amycolatopsis kentuckyensis TaxID=218823 RepID=UPI0035685B67
MTEPQTEFAYRIVDGQNRGWLSVPDTDRYWRFDEQAGHVEKALVDIEHEAGGSRPVVPPRKEDVDELHAAFAAAGRKMITSLASALEQVFHEARERDSSGNSWDYAQRTLMAGRPGSWESVGLTSIVVFGNGLNLWPYKDSTPVDEMRATGPNPKRVDVAARDRIAAVLRRWTASDEGYTEVAENLADIVASFADEQHGADGWAKIADQWLQPKSLAQDDFRACYRVLYSTSSHLNTDYC